MWLTKAFYCRPNPPHSRQWILSPIPGLISLCILLSCDISGANAIETTHIPAANLTMDSNSAIKYLTDNFEQLPERQIARSDANKVYAMYAQPTARYTHQILGDSIEAMQLVVLKNGTVFTHTVGDQYVFEDIKPRLSDVDSDGEMEIITIRTHLEKGAGIMIYKIMDGVLTEFAWVEEIGRPNRWLNIAAVCDLDGDGTVELAWIQTPHIGGILKVAGIKTGKLEAVSELSGYSNHSIGERNLCLAAVTKTRNVTTLYVPTQNRLQIAGFRFTDGSMRRTETINQPVDFSFPLVSQYDFPDVVQGNAFCSRR